MAKTVTEMALKQSRRDMEIFDHICLGKTVSEVAEMYGLSVLRVRNIYKEVSMFLTDNKESKIHEVKKLKKDKDSKDLPVYKQIGKECLAFKEKGWSDKRIARKLKTKPATVRRALEYLQTNG